MHRMNTARLEELEQQVAKHQKEKAQFGYRVFAAGIMLGVFIAASVGFGWKQYQGPTIVYSYTHDGPRNQRSGSTFKLEGAVFNMPYNEKSDTASSIEGPQTFDDMMDCALDDFKEHKFFEQNHQSSDSPIKAIEIRVWK